MNETFFTESVDFAKQTLMKHGEMLPMFVGHSTSGVTFVVVTPWTDNEHKQRIVNWARFLFLKEAVFEYCFMTEMWFKSVHPGAEIPNGPICEMPDKKEGLVVIYGCVENGKIEKKGTVFETIRNNGTIELIKHPFEVEGGVFTELLSPKFPFSDEVRSEMAALLAEYEKRYDLKFEKTILKKST